MRLFMAFPDGALHYDCAQCNALCCRGQGISGNMKKEMKTLLELFPALAHSAVSSDGDIAHFYAPTGRCFFLEADNLCKIEKKHGKALKPAACSLFPFNSFSIIGDVVAVSPHFLCPLLLELPPRPGKVTGTHGLLERALRESSWMETFEPGKPSIDTYAFLLREVEFRSSCTAALGRTRFRDLLHSISKDSAELNNFVKRAGALLGLELFSPHSARDLVDDQLLVIASSLRMGLAELDAEAVLRFLALGEAMLRSQQELSAEPRSLQAVHKTFAVLAPTLRLLAYGELALPAETEIQPLKFSNTELTLSGYQAIKALKSKSGVLSALENSLSPELSASDRSILLFQLGSAL